MACGMCELCLNLGRLADLNLNQNRIPNAPEGLIGFPSLRVLSICYNKFEFYEDVFPLTQVKALKAILLYGNRLISRKEGWIPFNSLVKSISTSTSLDVVFSVFSSL
jgi:hypothetical protein